MPLGPKRTSYSRAGLILAFIIVLISSPAQAAKPAAKGKDTAISGDSSSPMTLTTENYNFRNLSGDNSCLGEDDHLVWKAIGSLQPGESFSFTPRYAACNYHPAAISVQLSWSGSELKLSSNVPYRDYATADMEQTGMAVTAANVGNTSQLCMFPNYKEENINYTITVTNVGNSVADNVVVDGHSENDWVSYYYSRCINADTDHDGWNDALEHTMSSLVRSIGYIDGEFQMNTLWGPNYLRARSSTTGVHDEIDSDPADLNDDGQVDRQDVDRMRLHVGEGNGIPLAQLSPNPGDDEYLHKNDFEWRRYDLDADGYVSQTDVDIVSALVGSSLPMAEDILPPTARVLSPVDGASVTRGSSTKISGHVWDNASIARVQYLVDGQVICEADRPSPVWGTTSPYYACWWNVPKRQGTHELAIRVYDNAGNQATSQIVQVTGG